jgi:hypothetical protein
MESLRSSSAFCFHNHERPSKRLALSIAKDKVMGHHRIACRSRGHSPHGERSLVGDYVSHLAFFTLALALQLNMHYDALTTLKTYHHSVSGSIKSQTSRLT